MAVPLDVRTAFVIAATVAVVAFASGVGMWAVMSAPSVSPCQWFYGGGMYCTQTLTTRGWCHVGMPCPYMGNSTLLLGYTFNVQPLITENGTLGLSVGAYGPGEPGTGHLLLSNPMGTPVAWTSSDGRLLVLWPNPPASWESPMPESATVICGVAGP
jgi:hypothetical protein